ncbi:MAG TPA: hypothetical protein PKB02_08385 [Anaerohalosphaeraceae bacterium]|nr:hypothetical protein [Anaerohalosphaeraceae bacterium]
MRFKEEKKKEVTDSPYISPNELAQRWQCARSSVDRIARRAGLSRLCLGEGKNGSVRYVREEVFAYEKNRLVSMN